MNFPGSYWVRVRQAQDLMQGIIWEFLPSQHLHFPQLCSLPSSNRETGRLRLLKAVTLVSPWTAAFIWRWPDVLQLYSPHPQQLYHCLYLTTNHSMPPSWDPLKSLFNLRDPTGSQPETPAIEHFAYRLGVTIQHHREHREDDSTVETYRQVLFQPPNTERDKPPTYLKAYGSQHCIGIWLSRQQMTALKATLTEPARQLKAGRYFRMAHIMNSF